MNVNDWFGFWAKNRPDDISPIIMLNQLQAPGDRRAIAVRAALRGIVGLVGIDTAPWSLSERLGVSIKLHALRAVFVAWCQTLYDGVRPDALGEAFTSLRPLLGELDGALPEFYEQNLISSDYAVSASQDNVEAGRRAAGLIEAIDTLEYRLLPIDKGRAYNDLLDTLALFGPDAYENRASWRAAQRAAIGADCEALRTGKLSAKSLMLAPLWPSLAAAALETNLTRVEKLYGRSIQIWLRERKDGSLVMGRNPLVAADRMARIANLPPAFWDDRIPADSLYAFDYALHGDLENPSWGSPATKEIKP